MTHKTWTYLFAIVAVIAFFSFGECRAQRTKAKTLSQRAAAARAKAKVAELPTRRVPSLQKLLDEMPKDSLPLDSKDDDGTFARSKANDWLRVNLVGKSIEFKAHLEDASVGSGRDGSYPVRVELAHVISNQNDLVAGTIRSGETDWNVYVSRRTKDLTLYLDEDAAKRLRALKGKDVTLTGTISGPANGYRPPTFQLAYPDGKTPDPRLYLYLADLSFVGFSSPKQDEPKEIQAPQTNVVVGLQKLLDEMPKDSQPRDDADGALELIKANEWLAKNLVGKPIVFQIDLREAKVTGGKDGKYQVDFELAHSSPFGLSIGKVQAGGVDWKVYISPTPLTVKVLDEDGVRRVQALRGKQITITGIVYAGLKSSPPWPPLPRFSVRRDVPGGAICSVRFGLSDVSIVEFEPPKK